MRMASVSEYYTLTECDRSYDESNNQDKNEDLPSTVKSVQFNPEVVVHEVKNSTPDDPSKTSTIKLQDTPGYSFHSFEKLPVSNWIHHKKEDLIAFIVDLLAEKKDLQRREIEAHDQVKKSIVLVEEIKFEKSEVLLANEQLKKEINGLQKKIDLLNVEHEKNVAQVKMLSSEEWNQKMMDVQTQMESVLENQARLYLQFTNLNQEKITLLNNLEEMKSYNQALEKEIEKLTINRKAEVVQAVLEKDEAIAELSQFRYKIMKEKRDYQLELDMLQSDNDTLRRHLKETENNFLSAKEECLQLSQTINKLQKMTSYDRVNAEVKQPTIDVNAELKSLQLREQQLQNFIECLKQKYGKTVDELNNVILFQRNLIKKFSSECTLLSQKFQEFISQHRNDKELMKSQLDVYRGRLEHNRLYRKQLQDQCEQHRNVHMAMGSELQMLKDKLNTTREQLHVKKTDKISKKCIMLRHQMLLQLVLRDYLKKEYHHG